MRSSAVVVMVLLVVAAGCASGENPFESLVETSVAGGDVTADLGPQLQIPEPSTLIIDEDPNSLIAATVMFEEGDHLVERIDFLGPKPSTNRPPTTALVYMKGSDEAFGIALDADGLPSVMYLVDVGELRFSFAGTTMTVTFMAPDGSTSTAVFALDGGNGAVESMEGPSGSRDVTGVRAVFRNAAVEVNRAVFLDVSVWTPDGELPRDLSAPFLQTGGCNTTRSSVTFGCDRVGARLVELRGDVRVYRLAMTHTASAVVEGLDASIWPSAQACEAALGNDWWVEAPLAAGLQVSSVGLGTALLSWLAASPEIAAASVAAGTAYLPAVAIAGTVAIWFSLGNWVGEQLYEGGEGSCERIKRRVTAMNMLGSTVGDIAFTVEVCLPPIEGWTVERECQDVGPYQPFGTAMQTTVGDAGTFDRNRLPSVDFIITPAPGSITGTVVQADTGDTVAGAVVTVSPSGQETVTDATGQFVFTDVPVGAHTIGVTADGFIAAAADIVVVAGEAADTTIGLEKDDELPWVFEGTGEGVLTAADPFGSGAPFVITELTHVTITLNADGTAVLDRTSPDTRGSLTVNCVDRTAYVSTSSGLPPKTTTGTHAGGEFEVPWGEAMITGTYSSSEIQGRWVYEIVTDWCDDITGKLWKAEFSFGPDGMARVYDTP